MTAFALLLCVGCASRQKPVRVFPLEERDVSLAAAFSGDGRVLAALAKNGSVRVWEVATGKQLARRELNAQLDGRLQQYAIAVSQDGSRIAYASWDDPVRVWRWRSTDEPAEYTGSHRPVRQLAFSFDDKALVAVNGGLTLGPRNSSSREPMQSVVWDLASRKVIGGFENDAAGALQLLLAPGGSIVAASGVPGMGRTFAKADMPATPTLTVMLFDATTGREHWRDVSTGYLPWNMNFSADGRRFTVSMDGMHRVIWESETRSFLGIIFARPFSGHFLSADGSELISLRNKPIFVLNPIRFYTPEELRIVVTDLTSGKTRVGSRLDLPDYKARLLIGALSPNRKSFVDHELRLWEVPAKK